MLPKFLLVTPVWNDSVRLEHFGVKLAKELAVSGLNITWVIADDGSDTEEVLQLERLKEKFSHIYSDVLLHLHPKRSFKGVPFTKVGSNFPMPIIMPSSMPTERSARMNLCAC